MEFVRGVGASWSHGLGRKKGVVITKTTFFLFKSVVENT